MLTEYLEKAVAYYGRMSRREQSLALAVGGLLSLMVCVSLVRAAWGYVGNLDRTIDRLQEDIVNYKYQIAHRQDVEALYARVAKQHSSEWTEAEIHDRLRQEIYRLAQLNPPQLDENGIPVQITAQGGELVDIPTLREGVLLDSGGEFREYKLSFRLQPDRLSDVLAFVERLQNSPQSLRIDEFVISRTPTSDFVSARMDITRTVVSGEDEDTAAVPAEALAQVQESVPLDPAVWKAEQCALMPNEDLAFHDEAALEMTATSGQGQAWFERAVDTGFSYDMFVEVAAFGQCKLAVAGAADAFESPYALPSDGKPYRYHVRFTVPGAIGGTQTLRTPSILLEGTDARVIVSSLVIRKAMV